MTSIHDCCDRASHACIPCDGSGAYRIGVYLADQISLVRRAHGVYEPDGPRHTWWVERLELECGCRTHRAATSASRTWWSERCPHRCDRAPTSWLARRVLHLDYFPGGPCADFTADEN